jgi:outer membrane lipoprotein
MKLAKLIIIALLFALNGCTPIFSEQTLKLVNTDAPFKTLKAVPENYIGKHVMLGGRIASVVNNNDGSYLEIVQFDLTALSYPEDTFLSYGRFLATADRFLDPMVFRKGMLITLVGEIKGKKSQRLENMDYTYPVLTMRDWYLWRGSDSDYACKYPVASPQYNPASYGYGYEPFLQRPYMPFDTPK